MTLTPQTLEAPHAVALVQYNAAEDLWQSKGSFYGQDKSELPYVEYRMKIRGQWLAGIIMFRGPEALRSITENGIGQTKGVHGTFLAAPSVIGSGKIAPDSVVELRQGDTLVMNGYTMIVEEPGSRDDYPRMWTPTQYGARRAADVLRALGHGMPSSAEKNVIGRALRTLDEQLIVPPVGLRGL